MASIKTRQSARKKRQTRVRKKIRGTDERPRLCVYRSLRYTYAQLVSDESGRVLTACSSKELAADGVPAAGKDAAKLLGQKMAERAKDLSVSQVVFDRNGYVYHGRVAAVAEGAREGGLNF